MDTHQPEVLETTLQKTNVWLKEISDLLHWEDHQEAYLDCALFCTLCAIVCQWRKQRTSALSCRCLCADSTTIVGSRRARP